mgnify:CR=1 FL=1
MEKGEGPQLAEKYFIFAYPSLLFVNYDGTVAHRFAGYQDQDGVLALGSKALDGGANLEALAKEYAKGNRDANFLINLLYQSSIVTTGHKYNNCKTKTTFVADRMR